jgi:hypothetical protein
VHADDAHFRLRATAAAGGLVLTRRATTLLSGAFLVAFDDERAAQAAARDCRSTGFVAAVGEGENGSWVLSLRRNGNFPADERDRYASRLLRIVAPHGGRYDTFAPDERAPAAKTHERATA